MAPIARRPNVEECVEEVPDQVSRIKWNLLPRLVARLRVGDQGIDLWEGQFRIDSSSPVVISHVDLVLYQFIDSVVDPQVLGIEKRDDPHCAWMLLQDAAGQRVP